MANRGQRDYVMQGKEVDMLWLLVPLFLVLGLLWCCLGVSGDIAEAEERELGVRRS